MLQNIFRCRIKIPLLCASLAVAIGTGAALAQSGSAGGSIGNDEKSLSGSRSTEPERPVRRSKPEAEELRRSAPRRSGGGGSNFDGAWTVVAVGTTCPGSSTTAVVISGGRIIGQGVSGTISANGASRSVASYEGMTVVSSGRASGRGGSGTFKRSDGCSGTWTSSKQ